MHAFKDLFLQQMRNQEFKEHEKGRVNPCYVLLEDVDLDEGLNETVPYVWVVNREGKIAIGIEKPWLYPQAFGYEENDQVWAKIKEQLLKPSVELGQDVSYGHPTIAPIFNKKGEVTTQSDDNLAYIGGELFFENGTWVINNKSGRFRDISSEKQGPLDKAQVKKVLNEVANQFLQKNLVSKIDARPYSKEVKQVEIPDELIPILELLKAHFPSAPQQPKNNIFNKDNIIADKLIRGIERGKFTSLESIANYLDDKLAKTSKNDFENPTLEEIHKKTKKISSVISPDLQKDKVRT